MAGALGMHDQLELFARIVGLVAARIRAEADRIEHAVRACVEQPDGRIHQPVERVQRCGSPQRHAFGTADCQRFRREFTEHDMQIRNQRECEHQRDHRGCFRADAEAHEHRFEQVCERGLADPAKRERGERDAELAGRQIGIQTAMHADQDAPTPAVAGGHRRGLRATQLDQRELGRDEEAVEQYQKQRGTNVEQVLQHCRARGDGRPF